MNIELYIENEKVDLTDKISFPLNKKWDNLNNPTDIINDYSKVIEIPRTKHNDNLFGNIFKLDKYTAVSNILGTPSHKESGTYSNFNWTVTNASVNKLQLGVIDTTSSTNWEYVSTMSYTSNYGSEQFEFEYTSNTHRLEFSLRDTYNNEYSWLQYNITTGLTTGITYICNFTYSITGGVIKITNISLSPKDSNKYIFFNPSKKASFKLIYNGDLLMGGYCKMNSIGNSVDSKNYEINLFGQMGDLFQTMKDITFNKDKAIDSKYIIKDHFPDVFVNRNTVKDSWENPQSNIDVTSTNFNDWIGWMPTNRGLYNNFDSKITDNWKDWTQKDQLTAALSNYSETDAETIVGEGISEACLREYRSYYQKPYVYCNKLVQLLKEKFEEIKPGYTLNLDSSFFHSNNPYWTDLIMGCNYLSTDDSDVFNNYYNADCSNSYIDNGQAVQWYWNVYTSGRQSQDRGNVSYNDCLFIPNSTTQGTADLTETISSESIPLLNADNVHFDTDDNDQYIVKVDTSNMYLYTLVNIKTGDDHVGYPKYVYFSRKNALTISLEAVDDDNNVIANKSFVIGSETSKSTISLDYEVGHEYNNKGVYNYADSKWYQFAVFNLSGINLDLIVKSTSQFKLRLSANWVNSIPPLCYGNVYETDTFYPINTFIRFRNYNESSSGTTNTATPVSNYVSIEQTVNNRTGKRVNLGDLLGEDFNLFDFFMRYCKMFGLVIDYDNAEQTIDVLTRNEYFKKYSIVDWSDKVDRSKDFQISPIWFEHKYELFDYEDTDAAYYKEYRDKYGLGYGGKRINTGYEFNNEPEELMQEGYVNTILTQEHNHDWNHLIDGQIVKIKSNEVLPAFYKISGNKKEDIEVSGNFMFRKTENLGFDERLRTPIISDDSYQQTLENEYHWTQNEEYYVKPSARPNVDVEDGGYGCLWHKPSEVYYDYKTNDSIYLYDVAWNAYISDRYNLNNRKVTAYFNLSPMDYMQFKFYKFIKLDNCLYMVNQIYDYDVNSNATTKVELIQVSDITKYTQGQMLPPQPHWLSCYGRDVPNRGNKTIYFAPSGGTQMFYIEISDTNKPYTITKPSWVRFIGAPIESNGKVIYRLRATKWSGTRARTGIITVDGQIDSDSCRVSQQTCYISLSKTYAQIKYGESLDLTVFANVPQSGITWTISNGGTYVGEWQSSKTGGGGIRKSNTISRSNGFQFVFHPNSLSTRVGKSRTATITFTSSCGASAQIVIVIKSKNIVTDKIDPVTAHTSAVTSVSVVAPNSWKFKDTDGQLKESISLASGLTAQIGVINNGKQTITVEADNTYTSTGATTYSIPIIRPTTLAERNDMNKQLITTTGKLKMNNKLGKTQLSLQDTVLVTVT